jgi:hypothetical protein
MSINILVKLRSASRRTRGPFTILDNYGNVLAQNVSKSSLISGVAVSINENVTAIVIRSEGDCKINKSIPIVETPSNRVAAIKYHEINTGCVWRHLTSITEYNKFYGNIAPYIIEYPFAYQYQDEILQNVKDYTRAYQYLPIEDGVFNDNTSIEVNGFFNKAILYNGQQCSGLLNLVPKPLHNLKEYSKYPIYNTDSKTITYTKSDNFYQYNTFWGLTKDKTKTLFLTSCESLSIDKVLNQTNMDYGKRSFKKEPLRAKFLKVRHILDNRSDLHLVSGFIVTPAQISYK